MKKILSLFLVCVLFAGALSACSGGSEPAASPTDEVKRLKIVSTIFPSYDFTRQIVGDAAEVSMLLPPGSESHSYEPSPQDILAIHNCDLFIYVGGESDSWVDGILESVGGGVNILKMMECVGAVEEVILPGMQTEEDEHEHEDEKEYDEHVWTSPVNAVTITRAITEKLCALDAENAALFTENSQNYIAKLSALDADFRSFFDTVENKVLLFGDRFPFRYFTDEYGLTCYAAFPGCSNETEPSAETIKFLIDKLNETQLDTVFYIEFSSHKVADSIAEDTGAKTAMLHSCHNVSKESLAGGVTYIDLMRSNLATLKEAMS